MKKRFDRKWYTEAFLQELKATARVEMDGDLPVIVKHAPDALSPIAIDPRVMNGQQGRTGKVLGLIPEFVMKRFRFKMNEKTLADFRKSCNQIASATCVQGGIDIENTAVAAADGYQIPIRIYRSEKCAPGCPCLYFMHGGGFIGGSMDPYDEGWKLFVEKFHMVVVSVEYRLMPENPYPTAHEDCFRVLDWIHEHAARLAIDPTRVFACGDSAGGNLAQACSTRSKGTDRVRGQIILYAVLNPFRVKDAYYCLDGTEFIYEPSQKRLARGIYRQLQMTPDMEFFGVSQPDPYISPYTFDAAGNPPTLITAGSLDFLKNDNLAWAHRLHDAGVPVKTLLYNGMGHGYLNAMGVFPQAEDLLDEMGAFIQSLN